MSNYGILSVCGYAMTTKRRTKVEIADLDQRIRLLYERALGCRIIAKALGEHPAMVYKRLRAMDLIRTREQAERVKVEGGPLPFQLDRVDSNLPAAALGVAVRWFLERGYIPSLPLEPTRYDLIVESDAGLKRVQVKTTSTRGRKGEGSWVVYTSRSTYDKDRPVRSDGKRARVAYTPEEVDFFFIVTGGGDKYLVPREATGTAQSICLDVKYSLYKIS